MDKIWEQAVHSRGNSNGIEYMKEIHGLICNDRKANPNNKPPLGTDHIGTSEKTG